MANESKYVVAARTVLEELGGGPVSSRSLVEAAIERGLLENKTWVYHNCMTRLRNDPSFDTGTRGMISLAVVGADPGDTGPVLEEDSEEVVVETPADPTTPGLLKENPEEEEEEEEVPLTETA